MRIMGDTFNDAKEFYYVDWHLHYTASSVRLFPKFKPVNFIAMRFMFELLELFLRHDICCYIGGTFPTYIAGFHSNFQRVMFFIAL
jgi:hypothetical protein